MKNLSLNKYERLKSKKEISRLFSSGKFLFSDSFKAIWIYTDYTQKYPIKMTVSIPKKNLKHAVKRNLLKRRTKEAYRINKNILYEKLSERNKQINIIFIYRKKYIQKYSEIEKEIIALLQKITSY